MYSLWSDLFFGAKIKVIFQGRGQILRSLEKKKKKESFSGGVNVSQAQLVPHAAGTFENTSANGEQFP